MSAKNSSDGLFHHYAVMEASSKEGKRIIESFKTSSCCERKLLQQGAQPQEIPFLSRLPFSREGSVKAIRLG